MLAWSPDGAEFHVVAPDGAVVRHRAGHTETVARLARLPCALVLLAGRLATVEPAGEGRFVVTDVARGTPIFTGTIEGRLVAAGTASLAGGEHVVTVARSRAGIAGVGATTQERIEHAFFDAAGRRRERRYHRGPPGSAGGAPGLAGATILEDGTVLEAADLVVPGRGGRAVVGTAGEGAMLAYVADGEGRVTALRLADRRSVRWEVFLRTGRRVTVFDRLHLSGDRRVLVGAGEDRLVAFHARTGALLWERRVAGPGALHPAPVGTAAVWLGPAGPERLDLTSGGPELVVLAPLDRPGRRPEVRTARGELVVVEDEGGVLTALARALAAARIDGTGLDPDAPPADLAEIALAPSFAADAPRTLREPWAVEHGGTRVFLEGDALRELATTAGALAAFLAGRRPAVDEAIATRAAVVVTVDALRREPELEAAILARPDALEPRLVYGDWLLEQGDPRGELVAVQAALLEAPEDGALQERERALRARHGLGWLGRFARNAGLGFHAGFVRSVRAGHLEERHWKELCTRPILHFVEEVELLWTALPGTALALHGVPPLLRRLVMVDELAPWDEDAYARLAGSAVRELALRTSPAALVDLVASARHLGGLTRLELVGRRADEPLAALRAALPHTEVVLRRPA